jgi:hypothetical protein
MGLAGVGKNDVVNGDTGKMEKDKKHEKDPSKYGLSLQERVETLKKLGIELKVAIALVGLANGAFMGYHGYKRHGDSGWWGFLWFLFGSSSFPFSTFMAFDQGFGKPKS